MKKFLLISLASIALFATLCLVAFYGYKSSVLGKMKQIDNHIEKIWNSLYRKSSDRILAIENLTNNSNCDKIAINSTIINNKTNRNVSKVDELWNLEYEVNKAYLSLEECLKEQPDYKEKVDSLKLNAEELNKLVDEYNSNVLDFNKYYSTFPNFIFGSREGFRREKFFYLKYGEDNDEYYNQKKKTNKWIETGKWE